MGFSTILQWLDENSIRAFPITAPSTRYFYKGITQFDLYPLILDAMLAFQAIVDPVQLTQIYTDSTNLYFIISTSAAMPAQLTFTITNYATASYPQYIRDSNHNLLVVGGHAKTLPISSKFYLTNVIFEPSVTYEIPASLLGVNQISIESNNLTGSVTISEGYQLALIPGDQSIDIEVGRNEGIPLPCGNIIGLTPDCSSVVSSINGVTPNKTGNVINFIGGNHINVYDDPDNNRIYIGYDFTLDDIPHQVLPSPPKII